MKLLLKQEPNKATILEDWERVLKGTGFIRVTDYISQLVTRLELEVRQLNINTLTLDGAIAKSIKCSQIEKLNEVLTHFERKKQEIVKYKEQSAKGERND